MTKPLPRGIVVGKHKGLFYAGAGGGKVTKLNAASKTAWKLCLHCVGTQAKEEYQTQLAVRHLDWVLHRLLLRAPLTDKA